MPTWQCVGHTFCHCAAHLAPAWLQVARLGRQSVQRCSYLRLFFGELSGLGFRCHDGSHAAFTQGLWWPRPWVAITARTATAAT